MAGINPTYQPPKKGGGVLGSLTGGAAGSVLGGIIGGLLAVPTGGMSVPGAAAAVAGGALGGTSAGGGAGSMLGGLAGEAIDPSKAGSVSQQIPEQERAAPMQSMQNAPEVQMAQLQRTNGLLSTSNIPGAQDYMNMVTQAQEKLKQRLGGNSSLGGGYA